MLDMEAQLVGEFRFPFTKALKDGYRIDFRRHGFGGRAELLDHVAPMGDVYQAGTLSANPLAMRAGYATLVELLDGKVYAQLETQGQFLEDALKAAGIDCVRQGSLWWLRTTKDHYRKIFHGLLERGIYLPPSPLEVCFLSHAHSRRHLEQLATVLLAVFSRQR